MRLLLESESVSKALGLAAAAHKGQVYRRREPYVRALEERRGRCGSRNDHA